MEDCLSFCNVSRPLPGPGRRNWQNKINRTAALFKGRAISNYSTMNRRTKVSTLSGRKPHDHTEARLVIRYGDFAAMQGSNGGGQWQAESVSRKVARSLEPDEALEHVRSLVRWNPLTIIGDDNSELALHPCGADAD